MVEQETALDLVFQSLANPTRRDILRRVTSRRLSVSKIAKIYERQMSLAAVSKHLQVLERAKLVHKHRQGKEHMVELAPHVLKQVDMFLESYRMLWEKQLDRLEEYLLKNN